MNEPATPGMFAVIAGTFIGGEELHHPGFAPYTSPPACVICGQETHTVVTLRECVHVVGTRDGIH